MALLVFLWGGSNTEQHVSFWGRRGVERERLSYCRCCGHCYFSGIVKESLPPPGEVEEGKINEPWGGQELEISGDDD